MNHLARTAAAASIAALSLFLSCGRQDSFSIEGHITGLQTGDIVKATIPDGKYKGTHTGRIMIRSRGNHDIRTMGGQRFSMTKKASIQVLQHIDGYQYSFEGAIPLGN